MLDQNFHPTLLGQQIFSFEIFCPRFFLILKIELIGRAAERFQFFVYLMRMYGLVAIELKRYKFSLHFEFVLDYHRR